MRREFPEGSSGMVYGPDGPTRRTRAHIINGFVDPVETSQHMGRNQMWMDQEGVWLNAHFEEE